MVRRAARRLFAGTPHSGLWDGHIVNGISDLASIAQNSVRVLRALFPLTVRRCGLATGGAVLVWALVVALSPAAARDDDWRAAGPGWDRTGWSPPADPLGWLRQSRDSFQQVMRRLARRSAGLPGPTLRPEPHRPPLPPDDPEPDGSWSTDRPTEPQRIAEPGPDRSIDRPGERVGPPVKEWHRTWSPSCRRAGVPVEGAGWYTVAPGDTLWRIARVHYGNGRAWRRILHANWEAIADPNLIYACQRLFIPRWRIERPPCDAPEEEPPRRVCHRPQCEEPEASPARSICHRPPPQPDRRGPGGCSRCGAGRHVGGYVEPRRWR
jgi:LysM domain-containing protein